MAQIAHKAGWVLAGIVSLLAIAAIAGIVHGGPLDPPAAPGPTDATVINSLPYTISSPGRYVLKSNLTTASTGISVTANDVTIDLNGFALIGPGGGSCPDGIKATALITNLVVRNGTIRGWCAGGIVAYNNTGGSFADLRITGNATGSSSSALQIGPGGNVSNCVIEGNGDVGIAMYEGTLTHCEVRNNGGWGIFVIGGYGTVIRDCVVDGNGTSTQQTSGGISLWGETNISGCAIAGNRAQGISANVNAISISGNTVAQNGQATALPGIDINSETNVTGNAIIANGADGIRVTGGGNDIAENNLSNNANSGIYIALNGTDTRVDGNTISFGQWGIYVDGTHNTIVRNSVAAVAQLRYFIGGSNNVAGPEQGLSPAPALANPWANIDQ